MSQRAAGFCRVVVLAACLIVVSGAALAQVPESLQFVPENAATYWARTGLGKDFQAVAQSNALRRLLKTPWVQQALEVYKQSSQDLESPVGRLYAMLENPLVRDRLRLLGDMVSHEVFIYGDQAFADAMYVYNQATNLGFVMFMALPLAGPDFETAMEPELLFPRHILQTLYENKDKLRTPTVLAGFKVSNTQSALEQLRALAGLIQFALVSVPEPPVTFKEHEIENGHAYTLEFDGQSLGLHELIFEMGSDAEIDPSQVNELVQAFKNLRGVIVFAVWKDWILVGLAPSIDAVAQLGKGPALANSPKVAAVLKRAEGRVFSVVYSSESYSRSQLVWLPDQLESDINMISKLLMTQPPARGLPPQIMLANKTDMLFILDKIRQGIEALTGPTVSVAYYTEQGVKEISCIWSASANKVPTKERPELLRHTGGKPILFVWMYDVSDPTFEQAVNEVCERFLAIVDRTIQASLPERDKEQYDKWRSRLMPHFEKLFQIATEYGTAATGQEQETVIVLDGSIKVQQLHRDLPTWPEPMPLPSLGIVSTLKDADKFKEGLQEYRKAFNDLLLELRTLANEQVKREDEKIPELHWPEPTVEKIPQGELWIWTLPEECGVTDQLHFALAVAEDKFAFAFNKEHALRLLEPVADRPVSVRAGQPVAVLLLLDLTALLDAAKPWVDHFCKPALEKLLQEAELPAGFDPAQVGVHIDALMDVIGCFKRDEVAIYVEEIAGQKAEVTEIEATIEDLPAQD